MTDSPSASGTLASDDKPMNKSNGTTEQASEPSSSAASQISREGTPPPLPPRPKALKPPLVHERPQSSGGLQIPGSAAKRPALQSKATTAISRTEIQSYRDNGRDTHASSLSRKSSFAALRLGQSRSASEADTQSIQSYLPTLEAAGDVESLLGEVLQDREKKSWQQFHAAKEEALFPEDPDFEEAFAREFEELPEIASDGSNEDAVLAQWKSKFKHFLIISTAGKPIYSRHGSDTIISSYIGVIQTILNIYQDSSNPLKSFTAGPARFAILSKGNLNLIAVSRMLGEGENQLRIQLESLYMQILSTLTLPAMNKIFARLPSTDLRRPLQGTETLLSALADGFTRGSPSTLMSALECLRLRKSHRHIINNTLLKTRSPNLLYGLIVASGRLVSVVRPKKHSLHPGDLHLIFNMLFEAGGVKAGGGENWIPLCLPGFNNTGYLYMYVSFLGVDSLADAGRTGGATGNGDNADGTNGISEPEAAGTEETSAGARPSTSSGQEEIAIVLISADKESFFELREMRDELVQQLHSNKSLDNIRSAVKTGRPLCTDIVPGTPVRHFLYKSRGNVQFTMPSYEPWFPRALDRRRLMTLYTSLVNSLHSRPTQMKIFHCTATMSITLAWATPLFELLCVAPGTTSRPALAQAANRIVTWVRREEERLFIIGGAVF